MLSWVVSQISDCLRFFAETGVVIFNSVTGGFSTLSLLCGTDHIHGLQVHALGSGISFILSSTHFTSNFKIAKL